MTSLFDSLKTRGLVQDSSGQTELKQLLGTKGVPFYCGFDPTADSLHVGHMAALVLMRKLQQSGLKPIVLLGVATGMIGDPSGKSAERNLLSEEEIQKNVDGITR